MSVRDRLRGIPIKWREQVVPADWAPAWKSDDGRWVIIVNVRAHRKDGDFRLFDTQGWLEVPDWIQVGDFLTFRDAQAEAERLASQEGECEELYVRVGNRVYRVDKSTNAAEDAMRAAGIKEVEVWSGWPGKKGSVRKEGMKLVPGMRRP